MVYLRTIANVMKISGCEVPDWMLSLKKARYVKASAAATVCLLSCDLLMCLLSCDLLVFHYFNSVSKRKELLKAPPVRHRINTVSGYDLQKANRLQQMKESKCSKGDQTNRQSEPQSDEKKQAHVRDRKKKHKKNSRTSKFSKSDK